MGQNAERGERRARALARLHGWANVAGGVWPLVHMRSFEAVTGPKVDKWLVRTVAGLLVANGLVQVRSTGSRDGLRAARAVGLGTAATLAAIDLVYAPRRRISRVYLVDAALELAILAAWLGTNPDPDQRSLRPRR